MRTCTNRPAHAENAFKLGSNKGDSRLSSGLGEQLALTHISHHTAPHIPTLTFRPPMVTVSSLTKPCMEPEPYSIEKAEPLATYVSDLSWLYLRWRSQAMSDALQVCTVS